MCIIINYSKTIETTLVFKTAVGTVEAGKSFDGLITGNRKQVSECNGCKCIVNIVFTRHTELKRTGRLTGALQLEFCTALVIIVNPENGIIGVFAPKGDDAAGKTCINFFDIRNGPVDNQRPVSREKRCKTTKGGTDIMDVFEEVEMIFFYIKYNSYFREKA